MTQKLLDLTLEKANQLLEYQPETGKLFWRPRSSAEFSFNGRGASSSADFWNRKYSGKEASYVGPQGYAKVKLLGREYLSHRLVWLFETGQWPNNQLDHINGEKADNRIVNLREVDSAENGRNQRRSERNTSGITGVSWHKETNKWRAQITVNGRMKHLGVFDDIKLAAAARAKANLEYGYHQNHGRAV